MSRVEYMGCQHIKKEHGTTLPGLGQISGAKVFINSDQIVRGARGICLASRVFSGGTCTHGCLLIEVVDTLYMKPIPNIE